MRFENKVLDYIANKIFSNGISVKIAEAELSIKSRFLLLENLVKNKNIIHLGCSDHLELIENKIANNTWLHKRLSDVAKVCLGIDINEAGTEYIKNKLGYINVQKADILSDEIIGIEDTYWDYLVLGELLEHIDNPVSFLKTINDKYKNAISKIIITVPNAFCYQNFINTKKNLEQINSDHRYWFTPYTLAKILTLSGYLVDEYYFVQEVNERIGYRAKLKVLPYIRRKLLYQRLKKNPAYRTTLVMIGSFNKSKLEIY